MIKALFARLQQKHRTIGFPKTEPQLPEKFSGRPVIDQTRCSADCGLCIDICPVTALKKENNVLTIDLGKCLFCAQCIPACPKKAIKFSRDYRLAARKRDDLILSKNDTNVLSTIVFDLGRFGIQFVASPRHADGLLITGPVSQNMKLALKKTYDAVSEPKIVIAVGSCAISGGLYENHLEVNNGAEKIVSIDLYIPGCPPHPLTILDGLLRLLGKIEKNNFW